MRITRIFLSFVAVLGLIAFCFTSALAVDAGSNLKDKLEGTWLSASGHSKIIFSKDGDDLLLKGAYKGWSKLPNKVIDNEITWKATQAAKVGKDGKTFVVNYVHDEGQKPITDTLAKHAPTGEVTVKYINENTINVVIKGDGSKFVKRAIYHRVKK